MKLSRLTPEAASDLREIPLDIAADSSDNAQRLRSEIYEAFQRWIELAVAVSIAPRPDA